VQSRTVYGLLIDAARKYGDKPALHWTAVNGGQREWKSLTWIQYREAAEEIAAGLRSLGVRPGSIVALHSETRMEFYLADVGTMICGGVAAALYTAYPPPDQVSTLRRLNPGVVFVESSGVLAKLLSAADPPIEARFVLLTGTAEANGALTLAELRERGRAAIQAEPSLLESMANSLRPEDPAILYLTSGATGEPKMGLVSHGAMVDNVRMAPETPGLDLGPHHRTVAFLPSAHITQRLVVEILPILTGMPVYFSEGLSKLPQELKHVRPTFFVAPPRVWERMYSSICAEIKKRPGIVQRIFWGALGLGIEIHNRRIAGRTPPAWMMAAWKAADRLIFQTIRARLGGELKLAISGAAPLGKDLADFYAAIGLPIHEGYGLTEGGVVCLNPIGRPKSGSIGKPLPGVEMKIGEEGELIFRSPTVFSGYYQDPAATAAILRGGWLHTGDIAEIDAEGYVYITGRRKEVIVNSNGKKIYPAMVESLFKTEPLIHQVLILGDQLPYAAALFTLNPAILETVKGLDSHKGKPLSELIPLAPVQAEVKRIVAKVNRQLAPFEQIRKWHVLDRDFSIEAGEITPTMKVRRARVLENHRKAVQALYGTHGAPED
jgi:long-chain acyl-CoA synthetase